MGLRLVPITFAEACAFVRMWHRTHEVPPPGHKFSVGVADDAGVLRGVAIVGRPSARHFDNGATLEVTRTCTDGANNANSMLYAACARATFALGYRRLITYTEQDTGGSSLKAAGWTIVALRPARPGWNRPSRPRDNRRDMMPRTLWESTR